LLRFTPKTNLMDTALLRARIPPPLLKNPADLPPRDSAFSGPPITKKFGHITNDIGDSLSRVIERAPQIFGGRNRTAVLVAIRLLGETYPSELAALLGLRLYSVQEVLKSLESEGVIISRLLGRTRRVSLNPRYFASKELDVLLWKVGQHDVALQKSLATKRRRPRRAGKPGLA
jgi:DNA-binding transcriptional ArsR family regulator